MLDAAKSSLAARFEPVSRGCALPGDNLQVYREPARAPVTPVVASYAERSMLVHGDIRADNMSFIVDGALVKAVPTKPA